MLLNNTLKRTDYYETLEYLKYNPRIFQDYREVIYDFSVYKPKLIDRYTNDINLANTLNTRILMFIYEILIEEYLDGFSNFHELYFINKEDLEDLNINTNTLSQDFRDINTIFNNIKLYTEYINNIYFNNLDKITNIGLKITLENYLNFLHINEFDLISMLQLIHNNLYHLHYIKHEFLGWFDYDDLRINNTPKLLRFHILEEVKYE